MWNNRAVLIAVIMVVSFSLTLGYLFWQNRTANASATANVPPPLPLPPAAAAATAPVLQTAVAHDPNPAPEVAPDMPVHVSFRHPPRLNRSIARISNAASEPLTIQVSIDSAANKRTLYKDLTLEASGQAVLGEDEGYDLQPGDTLVLESPPYRQQAVTVP
jgi:hypothetical protein